jgi:hypothetical protein
MNAISVSNNKKTEENYIFNTNIVESIMKYQPSFKKEKPDNNSICSIVEIVNSLEDAFKNIKVNKVKDARFLEVKSYKNLVSYKKLAVPNLNFNKITLHHKPAVSLPEFIKTKFMSSRNKDKFSQYTKTQTTFSKGRSNTESNDMRTDTKYNKRISKYNKDFKHINKASQSPSLKALEYIHTERSRDSERVI